MNTNQKYSGTSILLHWLIAALIIGAFVLGTIMTDMRISQTKLKYYSYHKWIGITVLALVAIRLINRLLSKPPAYAVAMPAWQLKAAEMMHWLLYLLMFAVPVSGYLYTCAAGYPVVYLGLFELPSLIAANPDIKDSLKQIHELLNYLMLASVILHVLAALKHQLIDKDHLLKRMMPGKSS